MLKYSELRSSPRVDLNTAIPLAAPLCLYVEPTNVCNFRCSMCPESMRSYAHDAGYYGRMERPVWRRILADLGEWQSSVLSGYDGPGGFLKSLKFYFEGEPLLNRDLPDWISQARSVLSAATRLELTTNLSVLDKTMAARLVASGLDYVRISVYEVDDARHAAVTGALYSAAEIRAKAFMLRAVRDAAGAVRPFLFAQYFAGAFGAEEFRELWSSVVDEVGFEPLHNWGGDIVVPVDALTARVFPVIPSPRLTDLWPRTPCPAPFYMMTIHANGDVSACCVDWASKLKIGNVMESHLWEIWNGPTLRTIQGTHITGFRDEIEACAVCSAVFPDQMTVRSEFPG